MAELLADWIIHYEYDYPEAEGRSQLFREEVVSDMHAVWRLTFTLWTELDNTSLVLLY